MCHFGTYCNTRGHELFGQEVAITASTPGQTWSRGQFLEGDTCLRSNPYADRPMASQREKVYTVEHIHGSHVQGLHVLQVVNCSVL